MSTTLIYGLILTTQFMLIVNCQGLPPGTQSGVVREIFVRADFSPAELHVNTGDEVRWTNKQMTPISIVFPQSVHIALACRKNFGGFYTGGLETTLGPNESASLCFHRSASPYAVRMRTALQDETVIMPGAVRVSDPSDTVPYTTR